MHHRCFKIRLFLLLLSSLLAAPLQAATRHVQDAYGQEHEVPATPQRIVTLSEIDLDSVLALGIHPIGAVNGRGQTTLPRYLPSSMQQGIAVIGDGAVIGRGNELLDGVRVWPQAHLADGSVRFSSDS